MNTRCKKKFRSIELLVLEHQTIELCIFFVGLESYHNAAPQLFQILNLQLIVGVRIVSMHVVQYTEAIIIHGRHLVCSHESI